MVILLSLIWSTVDNYYYYSVKATEYYQYQCLVRQIFMKTDIGFNRFKIDFNSFFENNISPESL